MSAPLTVPRDRASLRERHGGTVGTVRIQRASGTVRHGQARSENPWVKEGEPACSRCGWPLGTVGHEVNCEETP
jgi:hypothetical protein